MNLQLAESISTYFAASNSTGTVCIADCFTQDAVVFDEGSTYQGYAAIQSWMQQAQMKYAYSVEPISTSAEEEHVTVVAKIIGNFPGSPLQLRYFFQLQGSKIKSLEIH